MQGDSLLLSRLSEAALEKPQEDLQIEGLLFEPVCTEF